MRPAAAGDGRPRIRAGDLEGAVELGLLDCIACGCCAYVCPSHIPLVQYFNYAKGETGRARPRQAEAGRDQAPGGWPRTPASRRSQAAKREAKATAQAGGRRGAAAGCASRQAPAGGGTGMMTETRHRRAPYAHAPVSIQPHHGAGDAGPDPGDPVRPLPVRLAGHRPVPGHGRCGPGLRGRSPCKVAGRPLRPALGDGSALLTGWLLALSLPPWAPWWIGGGGRLIAIVVAKQVFGGLGQNLFNPAMVARVALLISFPLEMTRFGRAAPHRFRRRPGPGRRAAR